MTKYEIPYNKIDRNENSAPPDQKIMQDLEKKKKNENEILAITEGTNLDEDNDDDSDIFWIILLICVIIIILLIGGWLCWNYNY